MQVDIVLVLYNSEKWLPGCIKALADTRYDHSMLNVILVDNASRDQSVSLARRLGQEHNSFASYQVVETGKNAGFGAACNVGAKKGTSPFVFFLNVDTEVDAEIFEELARGVKEYPEAGGFECRQLPYEMGHHIDPLTMEVPWASGAAMLVRREVYEKVEGFDPHIFMYCEDVDLSWRIRGAGFPLVYLPRAVVHHFVLTRESNEQSELREYAGTELGRLLLAYKYGGVLAANVRYLKELKAPRHYANVRKVFTKNYLKHFVKLWPFLFWRFSHRKLFEKIPVDFSPAFGAERGREVLKQRITEGPLISVVVRTHNRPEALRGALKSIERQTYPRYEIVVVEDGEDTARTMIESEFSHLPLRYFSTGKNIGRGKAGNFGLQQAQGEYLNFLDDDDYFYPDHLELMAAKAIQNPEADLVLGCAMVMKVDVESKMPYRYSVKHVERMLFERVDMFTMSQTCQIPIQSAMFKKSLFEKHGGLREDMEGNEDWAMWMKFLPNGKRIDPKHVDIHRATSMFLLPATETDEQERLDKYKIYDAQFFEDPSVNFTVTIGDMRDYYDDMVADVHHLKNIGKLDEFLQKGGLRSREK